MKRQTRQIVLKVEPSFQYNLRHSALKSGMSMAAFIRYSVIEMQKKQDLQESLEENENQSNKT